MSKQKTRSTVKYIVDIVTPVYGGAEFLQGLAESLDQYDAGVAYQWIIVDDATPEDRGKAELRPVLTALKERPHTIVYENQINGGFAKANNLGASKGRAEFILMLNSDTRITHDNWLKIMVDDLSNPALGVVGAKLLFFPDSTDPRRPAGTIQHAGVGFNIHGNPYHVCSTWPADHPTVNQRRVMRCVTGACLLTRRRLWRRIGGLDEVYGAGNFEDVEYCVRSFIMGKGILYEPDVTLYHYAGGSGNSQTARRNHEIFQLRNRDYIVWDDWRYY